MNPLYQQLIGQQSMPQQPQMNPFQQILAAMNNPAKFIKQRFPDIPDNISNDPNQILEYLQRTRGITNQQIQQLIGRYGGR